MQMSMTKYKILQHSEEENADEEFDFRPAVGEEDQGEQFISRCGPLYRVFQKEVKSKFVCTGINFHKKWILWGVLG